MSTSAPETVNPVREITESISNIQSQRSKPTFKVHKSLLGFAIPLSQTCKLSIKKDHTIHVFIVVVNPASEILVSGSKGLTPTGPVKVGVDKTLLESVSRVVEESTGLRVGALKAHWGTYQHCFPTSHSTSASALSPTPRPIASLDPCPSEQTRSIVSPSSVDQDSHITKKETAEEGEKVMVYSFLATVETGTDSSSNLVSRDAGWRWCSKTDIEGMALSPSHHERLMTALKLVQKQDTRSVVRIPPTRLIIPTFEVDKSLKAYLLPLDVLRSLPLLQDKKLIASVAIVHPTKRQILLVQRSPTDSWPNHWEFAGGGSERSDLTLLHTASREIKEETGLNIDRFNGVAGTFEIKKPGSEIPSARAYVFLAKLRSASTGHGRVNGEEGGIEVRLNPKEHQAYRWVGTKVEVEGLEVIPNVKVVLMDLLEALDHSVRDDQK